jgi:hypothetical protein
MERTCAHSARTHIQSRRRRGRVAWEAVRKPSALLATATMLMCVVLSGCGKSLPSSTPEAASGPIAAVGAHGAGGLSTANTTRIGGGNAATDAAAVALTVYPGLTPATRPRAVVLVSGDDWPAALAASVFAAAPLRAPLLYSGSGEGLPEASARALDAMKPLGTRLLSGTQVLRVGPGGAPGGYVARSIVGESAAALAVNVVRIWASVRGHNPRQVIVVASNGPQAMAMPAAGLSALSGAPILFVRHSRIPRTTAAELVQLERPNIYVVGPSSAVSESTMRKLGHYGTTVRIAGSTPASNAVAVARFGNGSFGWGVLEPGHGLAFASAARPLDGPASAPLAANGDYAPLLLLEGPEEIPGVLGGYVSDLQPGTPTSGPVHTVYNHGWVLGDESAISAVTQARLDSLLAVSSRPSAEPASGSANGTTPASEPTQSSKP